MQYAIAIEQRTLCIHKHLPVLPANSSQWQFLSFSDVGLGWS